MEKQRILAAKYLANFRCTGSACDNNCCSGWVVRVDADTLNLFAECSDKEMYSLFLKNVVAEKPEAANPAVSAKIALTEEMSCSFLNVDKLCLIHQKLGQGHLPCICFRYPREENIVDGIRERTATMSCPAAAAAALLSNESIQMELLEEEPDRWPHLFHRLLDTTIRTGPAAFRSDFHQVRKTVLHILQAPQPSLDRRLLFTGSFCGRLHQLIDSNQFSLICSESASAISEAKTLNSLWRKLGPRAEAVPLSWIPEIIKALTDYELLERIVNPAYLKSLDEVRTVFGSQGSLGESTAAALTRAEKRYTDPLLKAYPRFFENYLCNLVFKQLFPFEEGKSVIDQYEELILVYALLRIHLAAAGAALGKLDLITAIRVVSSFTRVWDTNSAYRARIWEGVKIAKKQQIAVH